MAALNRVCLIAVLGVLLLAADPAAGQRTSELSADLPDSRILRVQQKVEGLFVDGKFDRAFFIYRNELAPLGDKYAQYMVGFMYQSGIGTTKDEVTASAWYRLAAERDTPEFVEVRDNLLLSLSERDQIRSDLLYADLRRRYGDLAVIMAAIKRDIDKLSTSTGSILRGYSGSPVTIIDNSAGRVRSGEEYFGEIRRKMNARVLLLIELGEFHQELGDDPESVDLRDLERLVEARLSSTEN